MESCNSNDKLIVEKNEFNCSFLESLPTSVKDVISWRCPILTGSIMFFWLVFAIMVKTLSFISVTAYIGLLFIISSMILRFYSHFINNNEATGVANIHPFQQYLDKDVNAYLTKLSDYIQYETTNDESRFRKLIVYLNSIFLLESYYDVAKFFLVNVAMVYVGMFFNLIDLVTIIVLSLLTCPKIYSIYRIQIDDAAIKAREHVFRVLAIIKNKLSTLPIVGAKVKQM